MALNLHLKKGALHKALGVSQGKKIPKSKINAAAHSSSPLMRKRANFAKNAAKWKHGGKSDKSKGMSKSWHSKYRKTFG